MLPREKTKRIRIGNIFVGGGSPVSVQSMTNTPTENVAATLDQIFGMCAAGCDIARVAVNTTEAAKAFREIAEKSPLPIVADVHFDHRLAIEAIESGAACLRINPGNMGGKKKLSGIAKALREFDVPVRVGANAGSLTDEYIGNHGGVCAKALVGSALESIRMLEDMGVELFKVSVKANSVPMTVDAYRMLSEETPWPLHVGITEAGPRWTGAIKSSVGIGILLFDGIGDTIRVSLSADPVWEIRAAYQILSSLEIRQRSPVIVSCPTCGRCEIDVEEISTELEEIVADMECPLKIAIMGCWVNGPGEASHADFGIAGAKKRALFFSGGEAVEWIDKASIKERILCEIEKHSTKSRESI